MSTGYSDSPSDRGMCFFCDYGWILLIILFLAGLGYLLRDTWMPLVGIQTPTPVPTQVQNLGTGDVQVTLIWNTTDDLDLWVTDPSGEEIGYSHTLSASGGQLDVDANPGCARMTPNPVENIYWPTGDAPNGEYIVSVNYYARCEQNASIPYHVRLLVDGQATEYDGVISSLGDTQEVTTFQR